MGQDFAAKLSPEQIERNFADINPPLTPAQALEAGSRCLFCYDAPCIKACPTGIDVPQFIRQILTGNLKGSARTILEANILGHSCGRVCPTSVLCEGACVLTAEGKQPVEIGRLQRYAVDHVLDNKITLFQPGEANGKKVALIGGGPASLACAAHLRRLGYGAVIYDARPAPGGLDTYGIAAYKMRAEDVLREVELVRALGVEFRQGTVVGRDVTLAELERDYDAVFLGIGLGETETLDIPGEDLPGCVDALTFIEQTKTRPLAEVKVGGKVAVIGGGNTAIDAVTASKRLGADPVYMVYRRGPGEMSAFAYEYELAKQDAVTFLWHAAPVRVMGNGKVEVLECAQTKLEPSGPGKATVKTIPGSEFRLEVDMVIKALGQKRQTGFLKQVAGLELMSGCIVVDAATMQTANPRYFAGGDCVNGGGEVVDAVAHGQRAAQGIHRFLTATSRRANG
jgi:dihydropyrimidine dehydrogenase (NAD+) subunit PreT